MSVTLKDISLQSCKGEKLDKVRVELLNAKVEICTERAELITEYMKENAKEEEKPLLFRAKAIAHYLSNRKILFHDKNILAGTTGSKLKSAILYPEFIGLTIWSELDTIGERKKNPQCLSEKDAKILNEKVFPYWLNRDVLSVTKAQINEEANKAKTAEEKEKLKLPMRLLEKLIFYLLGKGATISHTVPMFERVLSKGVLSIRNEAEEKAKSKGTKKENVEFYEAVVVVLDGFLAYAQNLSKAAEERAKTESNPEEKSRFMRMAKACKNVPANGASNFYEAVTCVWLCLIAIHAENMNMAISPGRLDQVLYPYYKYYEKDIASGALTVEEVIEEAMEIVGSLFIKLGDNVNLVPQTSEELFGGAGTAPSVTVGGIDKDGNDAVNELTYIMLRVTEILKLREPNMNARFHHGKNEKRYRDRVAEVVSATKAVPASYNDVSVIKTLQNQGVSNEHAWDYAIIGCVEFAVAGRSFDASSDILLNLSAPLEMALYNGKRYRTGDEVFNNLGTGKLETFDDLWKAFQKQTQWLIEQAYTLSEKMAETHKKVAPSPLLSALFEGPMEKGVDLTSGGAMYNSSGATNIGFADVVDSLNAVKSALENKRCTMEELIDTIRNDFKDNKALWLYLTNETLKYGTKRETDEGMSKELIEFLYNTYQRHVNNRGGKYYPAYWTMTNHSGQGKITHALPNGRKAGQPFASGITPVSDAAKNLTECFNAVAALDGKHMPGGVALNIKFTELKDKDDIKKLGDFVEGYFKQGGLQVQFNIMSKEMLREARDDPSKYPHLLVRVSGYSAYFNDLSDSMKEELIARTEYGINDGKAVL